MENSLNQLNWQTIRIFFSETEQNKFSQKYFTVLLVLLQQFLNKVDSKVQIKYWKNTLYQRNQATNSREDTST